MLIISPVDKAGIINLPPPVQDRLRDQLRLFRENCPSIIL